MDYGNKRDEIRKFVFSDNVDSISIKTVMEEIIKINRRDDIDEEMFRISSREPIVIYIHTYGGDVYSAFSLYEIIKTSRTPVFTYALGAVMSAGLILYLAGHYRLSSSFATFMYHEASMFGYDKLEFLNDAINESKRLQTIIDRIIISNTKITKQYLKDIRDFGKDHFIDAKTAFDLGLIQEIMQHPKFKIVNENQAPVENIEKPKAKKTKEKIKEEKIIKDDTETK